MEKLKQSILASGLDNTLVIVDNAWHDKTISPLKQILQYSKTARMLITTQLADLLPVGSSKRFWLKAVDTKKGIEFFKKRVDEWNDEWSDIDVKTIVEKTGGVVLFMSFDCELIGRGQ